MSKTIRAAYFVNGLQRAQSGTRDLSLSDARALLEKSLGRGGSLSLFPDNQTMLVWHEHGLTECEIQSFSELKREFRRVYLPRAAAIDALAVLFGEGGLSVDALANLPGAYGERQDWEVENDLNYAATKREAMD